MQQLPALTGALFYLSHVRQENKTQDPGVGGCRDEACLTLPAAHPPPLPPHQPSQTCSITAVKLFQSTFWLIAGLFCGERDLQAQQVFKGHTCSLCTHARARARSRHTPGFLPRRTDAVTQHQLRGRCVKTLRAAIQHPHQIHSCLSPALDEVTGPLSPSECVWVCVRVFARARAPRKQWARNVSRSPKRDLTDLPPTCEQWGVMDEMRRSVNAAEATGRGRKSGRGAPTAGGTREGSQRERDDR